MSQQTQAEQAKGNRGQCASHSYNTKVPYYTTTGITELSHDSGAQEQLSAIFYMLYNLHIVLLNQAQPDAVEPCRKSQDQPLTVIKSNSGISNRLRNIQWYMHNGEVLDGVRRHSLISEVSDAIKLFLRLRLA